MATLGKTATPNSSTHGWIADNGKSVGMRFTMPAGGGIVTSVSIWAAGNGSNVVGLRGAIWDATSNALLASGNSVSTSGGSSSSPGGDGAWHTSPFIGGAQVFIAGGTDIFIGWVPTNSLLTDWAYNGGDHSPDAVWKTMSGTPAGISGYSTESPAGAVACFMTYTPVSTPTVTSFTPTVGPVGTAVDIFGTNFTAATDVQFNGTSVASFTIVNDTHITTTVPTGATAGPINVINPDGTGTSSTDFVVGSVFADNGSAFVTGSTIWGDNGASWASGGQVWIDDGAIWRRVL